MATAVELVEELRTWLPSAMERYRASHVVEPVPSFGARLAWQRNLHHAGWAVPGWAVEHGGRGLTGAALLECEKAFADVGAPLVAGVLGIANVGPTIAAFGTSEQQASLSRISSGEEIWCQGFSEPDAGSDLASLRTRGVLTNDRYVIDGQKVWTSNGMEATHCQLLVRTDRTEPRHRGITCLLVALDRPGISRRPLRTLSGDDEFAELHFDGVEVPADAVLGEPGAGWRVATATLAHERVGVAARAASLRREVEAALRDLSALDPVARHRLVARWTDARVLELLTERVVAGGGGDAAPAIAKVLWGLTDRAATEAIADAWSVAGAGAGAERAAYRFLLGRSSTIAAGTTEVLRNVIAEQGLGLPREG